VPYADPNYPLAGYYEAGQYKMSLPQLLFGEAKTNLGEMIVLQQLLRDNFYTTVLAPIEVLPNGVSLTVKMDQITFKPILPQITPEEGTALHCTMTLTLRARSLSHRSMGIQQRAEDAAARGAVCRVWPRVRWLFLCVALTRHTDSCTTPTVLPSHARCWISCTTESRRA
jgi:hypothetical protein